METWNNVHERSYLGKMTLSIHGSTPWTCLKALHYWQGFCIVSVYILQGRSALLRFPTIQANDLSSVHIHTIHSKPYLHIVTQWEDLSTYGIMLPGPGHKVTLSTEQKMFPFQERLSGYWLSLCLNSIAEAKLTAWKSSAIWKVKPEFPTFVFDRTGIVELYTTHLSVWFVWTNRKYEETPEVSMQFISQLHPLF